MNKLFSVIVPVYNSSTTLNRCFDSICSQNFDNCEIIFVDDGSSDSSREILNDIQASISNVKVLFKDHVGACSARNYGFKNATGKYILYLDSDDVLNANIFKELNDVITKYNDIDMVVYKFVKNNDKNTTFGFDVAPGYYQALEKEEKLIQPYFFKDMIQNKLVLNSWNVCYKRSFLLEHFCKDESIVYGEDWAYSYECLYYAKDVYFLDKALYVYDDKNTESVMNSERNLDREISDFCKLMQYIGNSFAFSSKDINQRFAKCCLYGISKLLIDNWGSKKTVYKEYSNKLDPNTRNAVCILLKKIKTNLKFKDLLYCRYLLTVFR